jgi:hypothetical protein
MIIGDNTIFIHMDPCTDLTMLQLAEQSHREHTEKLEWCTTFIT